MAWRACRGVVVACVVCVGLPSCGLWALGDVASKEPVGPPMWIAGALIGITMSAVAGLLACALVRPRGEEERLDAAGAKVVDEDREARFLRYLLGILFACSGAMVSVVYLSEVVYKAMPWK